MQRKVVVTHRWLEPVPVDRQGRLIPQNQWPRKRRRSWVVRWYAAEGNRRQKSFRTKQEAEEFAAARQAEFDNDPAARRSPATITLAAFIEEFKTLRLGPLGQRIRESTVADYRRALDSLAEFVGRDTLLKDIGQSDVSRFVAMLQQRQHARKDGQRLSAATINKVKREARAAFNVAVRQLHYLPRNPFEGVAQDRIANKSNRYVSPSEFAKLLNACDDPANGKEALWWRVLLLVLYTAALRINEAIHMTWADLDFERDQVEVIAREDVLSFQPKGKRSRIVPLPKATTDALARLQVEHSESGNPYVFISSKRLERIRLARDAGLWTATCEPVNHLRQWWREILKAAGIKHATFHDLRRSAITNWARKLPAHVVQKLAGHVNIQTTVQFYTSVLKADLEDARQVAAATVIEDAGRTQDAFAPRPYANENPADT